MTGSGTSVAVLIAGVASIVAVAPAATAQQPRQQQAQVQAQSAPPAPQPAAASQTPSWESFPTMQLERVYRGPLRDTIIQRFRDPVDGTVCFVYIPISAPLVQQAAGQAYVQYGPNVIGSVSCVHPTQLVQLVQRPAPVPPSAATAETRPAARQAGR
jgi:hypothetical protein